MQSGTVLQVIATDPGAPADFSAFCRQTGNTLLESATTADGKFKLVLQRK
jgi:tRNA 2-thiouridine synthesizing protein A